MNPFEMVIGIVLIVSITSILKARYRAQHGIVEDEDGNQRVARDPDTERLCEEIRSLKERIAVLERLATEENGARVLDREIEKLR